jgi:hypothetical protein
LQDGDGAGCARPELEESVESIKKLTRTIQFKEDEIADVRKRHQLAEEKADAAMVTLPLICVHSRLPQSEYAAVRKAARSLTEGVGNRIEPSCTLARRSQGTCG